ncbi:hypothetical protein FFI89_026650 [Bradyrhizobium sp. KBS0727]|nr:hypothetical protein FFI71_026655 [Bradyrhizobium sp. KBS0725]QDW47000.1 hypothetical protein FFI89_026650 [Bradyrhizobium sp. KBS0727]
MLRLQADSSSIPARATFRCPSYGKVAWACQPERLRNRYSGAYSEKRTFGLQTWLCDLAAQCARSFAGNLALGNQRAQGRPGARCTRGLACDCTKQSAHEHTGQRRTLRPSLRNGFTAYFALAPVTGFLATVIPEKCLLPAKLDASTGASGPHDFTVRSRRARQSQHQRPPLPAPRSRRWPTPLWWDRMAGVGKVFLPDMPRREFFDGGIDQRVGLICPSGCN